MNLIEAAKAVVSMIGDMMQKFVDFVIETVIYFTMLLAEVIMGKRE